MLRSPAFKIEESDKVIEIYLTEAELQAIYDMPLSGKQDEVRDIFLVGCYTCQQVSDYNDIDKDCFPTTAKGTPVIRLVQKKTFMDYIKHSSDEIADEIGAIANGPKSDVF